MIVLTGTVRIQADKLDQARPLMKAVIEVSLPLPNRWVSQLASAETPWSSMFCVVLRLE